MGSDLAAISSFFDRPYETPAKALTPPARAFVLGEASYRCTRKGASRRRVALSVACT